MSEEFGLIINNQNAIAENVHIDWNREDLIKYVRSVTEQYKGRVYTDDDISNARADRAKLNSLKTAIADSRIQVKKAVMAPYERFDAEVAEVTALIVEAIKPIDASIKNYDESQRENKRRQLAQYFDSIIGDFAGSVPFERVLDPKMLNATVSMKKAKESIASCVQKIKVDVETINTVVTDKYRSFAVANYLQTMKLAESMKLAQRMEQEDKRMKERLASENVKSEAASVSRSAPVAEPVNRQPAPSPQTYPAQHTNTFVKPVENGAAGYASAPADDNKRYSMKFCAIGTKAQLMALKQYMIENNIKYGKA